MNINGKKIIYLRLPRTGSGSLTQVCRNNNILYFSGRDKEMGLYYKNPNKSFPDCVKSHMGDDKYNNTFTFSSIRNPWDRAVSMWKLDYFKHMSFGGFCTKLQKNTFNRGGEKWHTASLFHHLVDNEGALKVDFIVRFENFKEDFNTLCTTLNLTNTKLPHKNKSNHKPYIEHYNDKTKKIIAQHYKEDIEYFSYGFGE